MSLKKILIIDIDIYLYLMNKNSTIVSILF